MLAALRRHDRGWRGELPATFGTFFGHPVGIEIETQSTGKKKPSIQHIATARNIITDSACAKPKRSPRAAKISG